jgi:uncharacterized protein YcaQ
VGTASDFADYHRLTHTRTLLSRRATARGLLSPFDPVVWNRDRIEIYVPASKRQYGCSVLPFLLSDELVSRVDLKADRASRRLLVQSASTEPGVDKGAVAVELAEELAAIARWLGLDAGFEVVRRGDLVPPLAQAVGGVSRCSRAR